MQLRNSLNDRPKIRFGRLIQKSTYPAIASFISFIGNSQPGQALTFNFNYADQTPQHTITALEEAGAIWARHLQNNITLNIDVSYGELPDGMLGGARPGMIRARLCKTVLMGYSVVVAAAPVIALIVTGKLV